MSLNQDIIAIIFNAANFEGKLNNKNCLDFLNIDSKK